MSDVINSIFGRSKNETPQSGGYVTDSTAAQPDTLQSGAADVAVADETPDTEANEVDQTETVEPTDSATESVAADEDELGEASTGAVPAVDDVVDSADEESADSDQAEDDLEDDVEESDEAAADGDVAEVADEDGGIAEDAEAVAVESVDAPAAVVAESDEDDIEQAESAVEPVTAETRPAAGTRGDTSVGDGVVAKVVTMVALKAEGVYGFDDKGTSVELDGDIATIKVSLVVEFGHVVKTVAKQTRIAVIEAVEQFLSLDVAGVDVHVTDIHLPDAL